MVTVDLQQARAMHSSRYADEDDDPVVVRRAPDSQHEDALQLPRYMAPRWVPLGEDVQIAGRAIRGGGFYVGSRVRTHDLRIASLIEPGLRVASGEPDWAGTDLSYYPEYAHISPRSRATFLAFLNSTRARGQVAAGYVFLYFYGLERRILVDGQSGECSAGELAELFDEVDRIRVTYGPLHWSVQKYALELSGLRTFLLPEQIAAPPPPREAFAFWSHRVLFPLARMVKAGEPISAQWAFAWARVLTEEMRSSTWDCVLDAAADLFALRFNARWPAGFKVTAGKSRLKVSYRFAAPGMFGLELETDLPDVMRINAAVRPLVELLRDIVTDLEPLRRARRSKNRTPLGELAAIPTQLRGRAIPTELRPLESALAKALAESPRAWIATERLLAMAGLTVEQKVSKRDAVTLALALENLGFAMEPDIRFGSTRPSMEGNVVVFRLPAGATPTPSGAYSAAQLMIQCAMVVAGADEDVSAGETAAAVKAIEDQFGLPEAERIRLEAHLEAFQSSPASASRIEALMRLLPEADRVRFGQVLVNIAGADGRITPAEVKLIERFYKALSLDASRVHADLHHASIGHSRPGQRAKGTQLDTEAIAVKLAETAKVQALLGKIFTEEPEPAPPPAPAMLEVSDAGAVLGLDAEHSALLACILEHAGETMAREVFEGLCEERSLMAGGALEVLNEIAFQHADEALLEGDDPLYVGEHARETLRAQLPA